MTSRHPAAAHAPRDLGRTRRQFLFARKQAAAHGSTAHYCRTREMGRWPAPDMTDEPSSQASALYSD
jgi:hypothetical protein